MRFLFELGGEKRSNSLENPSVSLADPRAWAQIFGEWRSAAGVPVDANVAMSVPAIWCAVTFLAGSIAALPIKLHRRSQNGTEQIERSSLAKLLAGTVNDGFLTSFNWRRDMMTSALLTGRGMTFIEKAGAGAGDAMYLWPLAKAKTTVRRKAGRLQYVYRDTTAAKVEVYEAGEVLDIKMLGGLDGIDAFNPVDVLKDTIGLGVALRVYASRFFLNGGVPALAMEGPAASPQAIARAKEDTGETVKQATRDESNIVYLPSGHKLTPIGINPDKSQLLESQRYVVEECSRIYNLPPAFLHNLVNATFANVEQQDLNFVKHCLVQWVEQWEQDLNAKLFGVTKGRYIEFDLNGLLRGDFLSRMQAYAAGIQNAVLKPNEARRRENLPDVPGGDVLMVNTAIQPIGTKPAAVPALVPDPNKDPNKDPNAPNDPSSTGNPGGEQDVPGDPVTEPEL